ncbi:MAG: PDZ domain-containing protein [Chitinophagaceae bacterium]|nr:MAG: PDZ domain-containing protein [Chitinophagaceae bacterium]
MRKYCLGLITLVILCISTTQAQKSQTYFSDPAISPDGSEIAFVSKGDIWTVSSGGGAARLLIARQGYDSRPVYSPDGEHLAFTSTLTGNGDIYTYNFKTGITKRITFDDAPDEVSSWSTDSKYIFFATAAHDISGMRDIYKIRATGGSPIAVTDTRYLTEYFAASSPDGKKIAFNARGMSPAQWWRNGHSHIDESEIWLLDGRDKYTQLTKRGAKDLWPMWNKEGNGLYFVSDRTGTQNLWFMPMTGTAKQLTKFTDGRVLWPTIALNGNTIVFEKDFAIWKFNTASSKAEEIKINLVGSIAGNNIDHLRLTSQFRDLAISPDAKKVAYTAHGEVFVTSSRDGGNAFRVTNTPAREMLPVWALNSNKLFYVSEREPVRHLYQYDFVTNTESQLTDSKSDDGNPMISPDGKQLAYVRGNSELHVMNIETKKDFIVTKTLFGRPSFPSSADISWSPDSKWIAYGGLGVKIFRNIYVVAATEGAKPTQVSFLANSFGGTLGWGNDGKSILFSTGQRTEKGFIAKVDLVPQVPNFREDKFEKLFTDQPAVTPGNPSKPATTPVKTDTTKKSKTDTASKGTKVTETKPPLTITVEGLRERLSFLPINVDINDFEVSRDGKKILVGASLGDQYNLYLYSIDDSDNEPASLKQLTTSPGFKANAHFTNDGKEIFYIESGRISYISVDSKMAKSIATTAEMDVDFEKEKMEVFTEVWETQDKGFYDAKFHGADWKKVHDIYEPLAQGAGTPDELRRILNLMVGELNASHSGVSGPPSGTSLNTGKLGLSFDPVEYENSGKFKVSEVIFLGPAFVAGNIRVGDYLIAIDGRNIAATDNLEQLLQNKIDKKVTLTISNSENGSSPKKVSVNPVSLGTEKQLLYKQWVMQQRAYVNKISNGKLGYIHMPDMSEQSLNQLYIDLDEENHSKEGVVVDIRNNNGGFVNAFALDVLSRKHYLTMTSRGLPPSPARVQLGQRAIEAPTVLVTNQHSLSDAEDFTEGYRTMGLGKVVGEPTAGWIVFTSSASLIDGGSVRLPFIKITDNRGQNMELNPRPVDIPVTRLIGEKNDSQLDAAVKQLLSEVGNKK